MNRAPPRRIGILAGGQSLPLEIAESLKQRGVSVHIVAIEGEADETLAGFDTTWVNWGQIGKIISSFKTACCQQVAIAGSVRRPDLTTIKPDFGFFRAVPTVLRLIRVGGDDAILRGVIAYFERYGLEIVGVSQVAPELLVGAGRFAGPGHRHEDLGDMNLGFKVLRALAPYDVGQAVVVARGNIEAIEGAEGTDRMFDRLTGYRHKGMRQRRNVGRGILIKAPKPGQELRVDMPAIGPETVRKAAAADLRGIAVDAGRVLAIERTKLQELADTYRIFVSGVDGGQAEPNAKSAAQLLPEFSVRQLGRRGLGKNDEADAIKGARLINAIECFGAGRAVVVSRQHVLVVEAGEGVMETLGRAADLRQWGGGFGSRRKGVAVMAVGRELDAEVISQAAQVGLAGVAVVLQKFAASVAPDVVAEADRQKLFIAGLENERS